MKSLLQAALPEGLVHRSGLSRWQSERGHWLGRCTWARFVMPKTKQMESKILDLPLPFKPVMALKNGSKPGILTRVAYDLKPSIVISSIYMTLALGCPGQCCKGCITASSVTGCAALSPKVPR